MNAKIKASGYLDKLAGGIRVYFMQSGRQNPDGSNIVLHESWHGDDVRAAQATYRDAAYGYELVGQCSNIVNLAEEPEPEADPVWPGEPEWNNEYEERSGARFPWQGKARFYKD